MAKKKEITIRSSAAEYLTYVSVVGDQQSSVEIRYEDENVWLTQKMMAQLYDVSIPVINQHIKKIFTDNELAIEATIKKYLIVQTEYYDYTYRIKMTQQNKIQLFEERKVRTLWDDEQELWYFSIIDVIEILTDTDRPRKYWNDLKKKLQIEGSELSEKNRTVENACQ